MNFSLDLAIWLAFCMVALITACGSATLANLSLYAVRRRGEPPEVIGDAHHWRTDQLLLVCVWVVFTAAGIYGLVAPAPDPPPPTTHYGLVLTWTLVAAVMIKGCKTVLDFVHTLSVWQRTSKALPLVTTEELATSVESVRELTQSLNEARLDSISATSTETLTRVKRVESATLDSTTAQQIARAEKRLDDLEAHQS